MHHPTQDSVWLPAGLALLLLAGTATGASLCETGQAQSPVDLVATQRVAHVPLLFQYHSQPFEAVHDGQVVHFMSPSGSALLIRGDVHELLEFTLRAPGPHRFDGAPAAGEIHLVHRDAAGQPLLVAIPLRVGPNAHPMLQRILDHLPRAPGERSRHRQVGINPLFLVPAAHGYFRYTGSLIDPPCTEPVTWLVFRQPLEVSADQIRRIAAATPGAARPVQPTNGRAIVLHPRD